MTMEQPYSASLNETETVAAQGSVAPRITLTTIKNSIREVRYLVPGHDLYDLGEDDPLSRLTLCLITTFSGYVVVGKSAPMSAENFDREKGQLFAYENAIKQLWPLMAFAALEKRRAEA